MRKQKNTASFGEGWKRNKTKGSRQITNSGGNGKHKCGSSTPNLYASSLMPKVIALPTILSHKTQQGKRMRSRRDTVVGLGYYVAADDSQWSMTPVLAFPNWNVAERSLPRAEVISIKSQNKNENVVILQKNFYTIQKKRTRGILFIYQVIRYSPPKQ